MNTLKLGKGENAADAGRFRMSTSRMDKMTFERVTHLALGAFMTGTVIAAGYGAVAWAFRIKNEGKNNQQERTER